MENTTGNTERIFPYKFIDIHCHLLPGVDDGSKNLAMSVAMAKQAVKENIDTIIVTPHNNAAGRSATSDEIRRSIEKLQNVFKDEGIGIRLYPGNELYFDYSLPERLSGGDALSLADTQYCLVEFHPLDDFSYISNGLQFLIYQGFSPILAHCERYECLVKDSAKAQLLVRQGTLLQVNTESVQYRLFQRIPKFVNELFRKELVSFVATDAHRDSGRRVPGILGAAKYLRKKLNSDYVYDLLRGNAEMLLADQGD